MDEKTLKLQAVMKDEAFVKSLAEAESVEQVQSLLEGKDISMSAEEIEAVKEVILHAEENGIDAEMLERIQNGELSEEDLEGVAGGLSDKAEKAIICGISVAAIAIVGLGSYALGYNKSYNENTMAGQIKEGVKTVVQAVSRW